MKADIRWLDDPQVFRVNRLDAHSDHKFYENKEDYKKQNQRLKQSLNGIWKFHYSVNALERPADFYQKWFNCKNFDEMKVPQHIELAGYDKIHYINTMYPWEGHIYRRPAGYGKEKGKGMFSQAEYNPVGSYIRTLTKEQATIFQRNSSVILGLYALADMGIHYDGWKLADAAAFFHTYGITDDATIEDIYDLIIADPANYLKYYIGYLEFLELKKDAVDKWEDNFTQMQFHKAVLDVGPASFDVIRAYLF